MVMLAAEDMLLLFAAASFILFSSSIDPYSFAKKSRWEDVGLLG